MYRINVFFFELAHVKEVKKQLCSNYAFFEYVSPWSTSQIEVYFSFSSKQKLRMRRILSISKDEYNYSEVLGPTCGGKISFPVFPSQAPCLYQILSSMSMKRVSKSNDKYNIFEFVSPCAIS